MNGTFRRVFVAGFVVTVVMSRSHAEHERERQTLSQMTAVAAGASVALSRPDVVFVQSTVNSNLLKGGFGEAHLNRHLISALRRDGQWHPISARLGIQGLDGLHMEFDSSGGPARLVVSEAKYGSSQLGQTRDGIQLGQQWRNHRLRVIGGEYQGIAREIQANRVDVLPQHVAPNNQRIQIPFRDGKAAVFWRRSSKDSWKFAGPAKRLQEASDRIDHLGAYLVSCGNGGISYETFLFRIRVVNDTLRVHIKDAHVLQTGMSERQLPMVRELKVPLTGKRLASVRHLAKGELAQIIQKQVPQLSSQDAAFYSNEIARSAKDLEALVSTRGERANVNRVLFTNSFKAGAVWAAVDLALHSVIQVSEGSIQIDRLLGQTALTFTSVAVGNYVGQRATIAMMQSATLANLVSRSSSILGRNSTAILSRGAGSFVGGGVATLLMSYGGYFLGYHDITTANQMAIAGVAGLGAGMATSAAAFGLVAMYGIASTGTAIGTLSGAAASSATLAYLGGGSIAAGGFGVAGGTVLLGTGVGAVVVVVGGTVYAAFKWNDEKSHTEYIGRKLAYLRGLSDFSRMDVRFRTSAH